MRKVGNNSCLPYYNPVPVTNSVAADFSRRLQQTVCALPVVPPQILHGVNGPSSSMQEFWYSQALRYSNSFGKR